MEDFADSQVYLYVFVVFYEIIDSIPKAFAPLLSLSPDYIELCQVSAFSQGGLEPQSFERGLGSNSSFPKTVRIISTNTVRIISTNTVRIISTNTVRIISQNNPIHLIGKTAVSRTNAI